MLRTKDGKDRATAIAYLKSSPALLQLIVKHVPADTDDGEIHCLETMIFEYFAQVWDMTEKRLEQGEPS